MGGNSSTTRKVSFGLDEDEKVTVIEGVKVDIKQLTVLCCTIGSQSLTYVITKEQRLAQS